MVETNELTRKLRTLLHPRAALIVYAEENDNHSTDDDGYFIEVRDIHLVQPAPKAHDVLP